MKDISEYPPNLQKRIHNAGGMAAYLAQLEVQGSKGGRKSSYKRTKEQKAAQAERMKAFWAAKRGENT